MRSKIPLYLVTLLIEAILSFFRSVFLILNIGMLLSVLFLVFSAISGDLDYIISRGWFWGRLEDFVVGPSVIIGILLGFFNIYTSINAITGFGGGHTLTRFVLGAREPSTRERERIVQAISEILSQLPGDPKGFSFMYVIDSPFDQVNLIGTTLYISSGAVQSENLLILLAHEIGHLNRDDGGMILALRRLVFPLFQIFVGGIRDFSTNSPNKKSAPRDFDAIEIYYFLINKILFLWLATLGGGVGVWLLGLPWAEYFRNCDYQADQFVAKLGWKDQLIEYLEQGKFYDTSVPYMLGWRPANELRIDRLQHPYKVQPHRAQIYEVWEQLIEEVKGIIKIVGEFLSKQNHEPWERLAKDARRIGRSIFSGLLPRIGNDSENQKETATQAPPGEQTSRVQTDEQQQQDKELSPKMDFLVRELTGEDYGRYAPQFAEANQEAAIELLTKQLAKKRDVKVEEIEKLLEEMFKQEQ